jgi:hypothetical protein
MAFSAVSIITRRLQTACNFYKHFSPVQGTFGTGYTENNNSCHILIFGYSATLQARTLHSFELNNDISCYVLLLYLELFCREFT